MLANIEIIMFGYCREYIYIVIHHHYVMRLIMVCLWVGLRRGIGPCLCRSRAPTKEVVTKLVSEPGF